VSRVNVARTNACALALRTRLTARRYIGIYAAGAGPASPGFGCPKTPQPPARTYLGVTSAGGEILRFFIHSMLMF
jgi:hypothetical protein